MRFNLNTFFVALIAVAVLPFTAHAQSEADENQASQRGRLDTVIVTARKKDEELQKTPLAVSAFNEESIKNNFSSSIAEFSKYTPNIILTANPYTGNGINMSIRGVSFADLEKTFEPSLGIYMDGVVFGTNTGALIDSFDLESIQILRGPQGTLYGRNTIGGVINVRRTRPTGELGAKIG